MDGLIVPPGQGRKLTTKIQELTFKVTGAQGSSVSIFEVVVPPGFDVGAHTHGEEEFFYILDGELELMAFEPTERTSERWHEWESSSGDRAVRAGTGSCMFVPKECPHAFRNPTDKPARLLFQCYPSPHQEHYFEELYDIVVSGQAGDFQVVQKLRDRYGVTQLTSLGYGPPPPPSS